MRRWAGKLPGAPYARTLRGIEEDHMIDRSSYINALMDALPDVVRDKEVASQIVDVVFSVPVRALENGDEAELPGLGSLSADRARGVGCVSYSTAGLQMSCQVQ
jgi:hypothetical protein